ncbi:MAG: DUF1660 family phage protein [Mycobacteriaceae bacterium]
MIACQVFGHRYRFHADDATLHWACARCAAVGGSKEYPSAEQARKFAAAFDVEDSDDLGRRAPLIGLLPLRIRYWFRQLRGR